MGDAGVLAVLRDLYASEINFQISTFWDAGFSAYLGDDANGFVAEALCESLEAAALFLRDQAMVHFPHSAFAAKYATLRH